MARSDDTPFIRASKVWDDRLGSLAQAKRNWQLAAFLLLVVDVAFAGVLGVLATQTRITPYVVEVDRHGHAVAFGPAEKLTRTDERLVRYLLSLYAHNVRTVTADAELQRHLIESSYDYTRGGATAFLNTHFRTHNPFERSGRETTRVAVSSILPIAEDVWQVQWTESTHYDSGRPTEEEPWQAVLVVETDPPSSTDVLLTNPLGLYVVEITWTLTL